MATTTVRFDVLDQPGLSQRISEESRRAAAGPKVLDAVGSVFYAVGWVTFWLLAVSVAVVRWCWAGVRLGWIEARSSAQSRGFDQQRWPVRPRVKPNV